MQHHFEINVTKTDTKTGRSVHYFATHERSNTGFVESAIAMAQDFAKRFPASEGFGITVTEWNASGTGVNFTEGERK